jgi:phage terminase large subunit
MECRDPELLLSGPAGTGKSRAAMEKMHLLALLNPGMRGLIVRKTLASLGSTALVTWREHVAVEAIANGDMRFYGGSPQEAASYRYKNGSAIVVGGMDRATRIMSSEYDVVYVQEAIELTENDWESITTRLRNGKIKGLQQILADTNPDVPTHWLNQRCARGATTLFESRHEDNPVLYDDDGHITLAGASYMAKLDALTGVRYQRLRRGVWCAAEGLIFEEWDPAVHLIDSFEPPPEFARWMSVDFGFVNPQSIQWWAEDGEGRLYLYRELYRTRRTVDQHARQALALVTDKNGRWTEPKPRTIICDHDAEGRVVFEREFGMSTQPAHKAVTEGIQAVQARLRPAADGRPRLFVMRDALVEQDPELVEAKKPLCTKDEIVGYIWDVGHGKSPKEQPVKENDHGCDAMRYMVAERDLGGRPRIRTLG